MATLLSIHSSLFSRAGQSSKLADDFVSKWLQRRPEDQVIRRDLAEQAIPALSLERFQAFLAMPEERTEAQRQVVAHSDTLIDELRRADVITFAVPMYNFNIPAALHNYFDHIARAGETFRYTADGPEGLLKGKQAYVFIARGGAYGEEHVQSRYLKEFLAFVGITDVHFVIAEGLALGEDSKAVSLEQARRRSSELLAATQFPPSGERNTRRRQEALCC